MLSQSLHLPDMLPSPHLAELRGLQHSATCCDTEASGEGLAQGTGQHWAALGTPTPQEGTEPGNAGSKKGQGAELTQRQSPALILLPEN